MSRKNRSKRVFAGIGLLSTCIAPLFFICAWIELQTQVINLQKELESEGLMFGSSISRLDRDEDARKPRNHRVLAPWVHVASFASAQAGSGCVTMDIGSTDITLALNTKACNGHRCPPCFIISRGGGDAHKLVLKGCSSMFVSDTVQLGGGGSADPFHSSMNEITLVNTDNGTDAKVSDSSGNEVAIQAKRAVKAFCLSGGGDELYFAVDEAGAAGTTTTHGTTTSGPLYQLGVQGENACPSGYDFITDAATCTAAAGNYGVTYANVVNLPDAIKGCFQRCTNNRCTIMEYFKFNLHPTGGTSDDLQQWAVCKQI